MHTSIMENKLDLDYKELLRDVLENGTQKEDRTGTGTLSLFGKSIRHDMSEGFPVLTTKKIPLKTVSTELKWFLSGSTDIRQLWKHNNHIWDGDYEKSGRTDYSLGPIYGHQWRCWDSLHGWTDQIRELIEGLKKNPDSRRHIVSAWNVSELDEMTLPPCHYAFQCYVADGKLSLMWSQRSADLFLGVPFNISSYGMLLLLLCKETGYKPGELIGNFGDIHLYKNHLEQAKKQISRKPYELPKLTVLNVHILKGEFNYVLESYNYHPTIKAPLSN